MGCGEVGYLPPPNPNPTLPYSTPSPPIPLLHPYPSPLLHYPALLGYVRLGKNERYSGVVLGKDHFSKDPLCYHDISVQFIIIMSTVHVDLNLR